MLVKNIKFLEKLKCLGKIEIFRKNGNFWEKLKFLGEIEILSEIEILAKNHFEWKIELCPTTERIEIFSF